MYRYYIRCKINDLHTFVFSILLTAFNAKNVSVLILFIVSENGWMEGGGDKKILMCRKGENLQRGGRGDTSHCFEQFGKR